MKKTLFLLMLLPLMAIISSCSDDDSKETLKGTIWTSTYGDDLWVLEFTGSNTVEFYGADSNMNQSGNTYTGTYTLNEDIVTFNLKGNFYQRNDFKRGVISGNSMTVEYMWGLVDVGTPSNEYPYSDSRTFRKK